MEGGDDHTPTHDDELARWRRDFLGELGAPVGDEAPIPDADAIVDRAKREARDEWRAAVLGVVATGFAVAVFLALVLRTRSMMFAALASGTLPVLLGLLAVHLRGRRLRLGQGDRSLATEVTDSVARSTTNHRVAKAGRLAMVILTVMFWVWYPFLVVSRIDRFAAEPSRVVASVVPALVVFAFALWVTDRGVRKAAADERHWRRLAMAMVDDRVVEHETDAHERDGAPHPRARGE